MKNAKVSTSENGVFEFFKAIIISLIITIACIIVFAFVIKFANLSDSVIVPVNMVIKAVSVTVGTILLTKNRRGGLKKGVVFAACYITVAFLIFSLLSGTFSLGINLVLDYIFASIVGAIVGVLRVNSKKAIA